MHLSGFASISLFIFVAIFAIVTVILLGILAFAITKIQQQLTKLTDKVEPVIIKASDTLDTVNRVTVNVGEKADHILTRGEALTDSVSENVEKTATVVQSTVTTPLINLSSLISGVSKGVSVWGRSTTNGQAKSKIKVTKS
jgi:predicted PurR-regulated permease PerM